MRASRHPEQGMPHRRSLGSAATQSRSTAAFTATNTIVASNTTACTRGTFRSATSRANDQPAQPRQREYLLHDDRAAKQIACR